MEQPRPAHVIFSKREMVNELATLAPEFDNSSYIGDRAANPQQ